MRNCEQATFPEAAMTAQNWPDSFEQVVLPHLDAAYNLARWLTRNGPDAQDAVQEAYLRAFRHFSDFRGGDARAWLLKIVRNTCYSWLRVNRPLQDAAEFDENLFAPDVRAPNPEEVVLQNDNGTLVREALEKLPPNFREVLILRELEGMSYREIAAITGMPAGTVMSSLSRARDRLRQVLTASFNGDTVPSSRRTAVVNA
jgi:RNA polymerase sigma-70 factor (ECF subfamily)